MRWAVALALLLSGCAFTPGEAAHEQEVHIHFAGDLSVAIDGEAWNERIDVALREDSPGVLRPFASTPQLAVLAELMPFPMFLWAFADSTGDPYTQLMTGGSAAHPAGLWDKNQPWVFAGDYRLDRSTQTNTSVHFESEGGDLWLSWSLPNDPRPEHIEIEWQSDELQVRWTPDPSVQENPLFFDAISPRASFTLRLGNEPFEQLRIDSVVGTRVVAVARTSCSPDPDGLLGDNERLDVVAEIRLSQWYAGPSRACSDGDTFVDWFEGCKGADGDMTIRLAGVEELVPDVQVKSEFSYVYTSSQYRYVDAWLEETSCG